ncbi:MAG: PEP-CTERM sorting domain-containing protein [Novosphingobium sp.]|uniref:PEP-CTERM sorting domain-containing protein n=1 Tax=Novosphingobium sp. TaxID=1874826 RepID=UPI0032B9A872
MIRRLGLALGLLALSVPAGAKSVLFIGNSFTFGAGSPVQRFHPERVHDLGGDRIGGVPALFKTFADQLKLDWQVSLETSPGKDLVWHFENRAAVLTRPWDVVLLQGYSTLDKDRPGDPARHLAGAQSLTGLAIAANPNVRVLLVATWSRADLVWQPGARWSGKPITRMADDLQAASCDAIAAVPAIAATVPVGLAWNRAFDRQLADPNPFDGIKPGQINLWAADSYHGSTEGYYLEALVAFGAVTRIDPRRLGRHESAARELGIKPAIVAALQRIAAQQLRQKICH